MGQKERMEASIAEILKMIAKKASEPGHPHISLAACEKRLREEYMRVIDASVSE